MHTSDRQHDDEEQRQHHRHHRTHSTASRNLAVVDPEVLVLCSRESYCQCLQLEIVLAITRDFLGDSEPGLAARISRLVVCNPSHEIVYCGRSRLCRYELYKRIQGSRTQISGRV